MSLLFRPSPRSVLGLVIGVIAAFPASASVLDVQPGTGNTAATPPLALARYSGTHGLRIGITDASSAYVQDNSPLNENTYRVRFYVNTEQLKMADGQSMDLFEAFDANGADTGGTLVLRVATRQVAGVRQLNVCAATSGPEQCLTTTSDERRMDPSWHNVELNFTSDLNDGTNANGRVQVYLDGNLVAVDAGLGLDAMDNDFQIDYARMGAMAIPAGSIDGTPPINGTDDSIVRFDDFVSQRANYIGHLQRFVDVPFDGSLPTAPYITMLYNNEVTTGVDATHYGPASPVTRAQMAVFMLRAEHGPYFIPTAPLGCFTDTVGLGTEPSICQLKQEGITTGCTATTYCPTASVTRAQMSAFILRALYGSGFTPNAPLGCFPDSNGLGLEPFICELAQQAITSGCGGGLYCPTQAVTRAQMARFMYNAFSEVFVADPGPPTPRTVTGPVPVFP